MLPKPVEPSAAIDQAVVDYGKMMRDLVPILDTHSESLKNMLIGFEHMVQYAHCREAAECSPFQRGKARDHQSTSGKGV